MKKILEKIELIKNRIIALSNKIIFGLIVLNIAVYSYIWLLLR